MNDDKINGSLAVPNPKMRNTAVTRSASPTENDESYYLSIGRLFHKISLSKQTISVTRYRPRHPYPGFNYQYRYRFHAPHHDTYEESYATFTTEKLEHYNWNYLDHYVCTGGDTEFVLVDALKYWRFRVYLLPLNNPATKKIIDGTEHYDIYNLQTNQEHQQMIDGLLKFIETAVNKIKRSCNAKKARMSLNILNAVPLVQPRRNSMSNFSQQNIGSNSPFRERLGSNRLSDRPRPRSGSKVMERSRMLSSQSQGSQDSQQSTNDSNTPQDSNIEESNVSNIPLLKENATNFEIIEAMKHQTTGLQFINQQQTLPAYTFVSGDAVNWLIGHMEGVGSIEQSVQLMQNLHREHLIRHASGDPKRQFVYGFYLFYIINPDDKESYQPIGDLQMFENEWFEVEIKPALNWGLSPTNLSSTTIPHFLCDDIDADYGDCDLDGPMYKRMRLETDVQNKSDRVEWGHARYQTVFRPDQAYELIVEWLTSSGSIVAELLSGWHRKAQSCGLQMIPIPHDPLALPYSNKSDPLRGPIFIPLDIKCIEDNERLFKEFREDTDIERLFLFQEAIIQRFGFIPCLIEPPTTNTNASREHQYIHATGTIFILISTAATKARNRMYSNVKNRSSGRYSVHADVVPSPHEAYITRHVGGKYKDDYDNSRKMGFLWSWNHMVSRRWRTNQFVDNNFQTKLLNDFRKFCSNSENRLRNFWEESWTAKELASTNLVKNHLSNNFVH